MVCTARGQERAPDRDSHIGLPEVEPKLERTLPADEREPARRFALPVGIAEKDDDARALSERSGAFGGLGLDGLLFEAVKIDGLLGPGAPIPPLGPTIVLPWITSRVFAPERTRVVLLNERYLPAAGRRSREPCRPG